MVKTIKQIFNSKRLMAILLSALIIISVFPFTVFAASENLGKVVGGSDINIAVSWHYGHQLHTTTKNGTTYPIFCIEYGTESPSSAFLKARKAGASANVIKAAKWIFAGYYMEHGNSVDWKDMAMCQKKVWSILGSSTSWDFSDSEYNAWCAKAEANMRSLDTLPSFDGKNVGTIMAGSSLTISDTNKVLKDYPAFTSTQNGITFEHAANSNTLKITISKACTKTSFAIANGRYYKENTGDDDELLLFYPYGSESYQKLVYSAYYDPVSFSLTGNITPLGTLKIVKTSEDNLVSGVQFSITGTDFSRTVVTNSAGTFEIAQMVPGKYTVTEQSIDKYEPQTAKTVTIKSGETSTVTFGNVLKRGNLQVTKSSEDGLVSGIKFHLTGISLSGAAINEYATTNDDGIATFSNILVGSNYTLEEVDTPVRYVIPDNQTLNLEWNKTGKVTVTNTLKKFKADVIKQDKQTTTAQGDATLAGAVYGIYDNGRLKDRYSTDENGRFTTSYYPCGEHWTIKEITPSEGYLLDETEYPIGASAGQFTVEFNSVSNTVKEQVIKGKIAIIKHSDDGSTQIETPEPEAEFQVYLKSVGSYANAKASERAILDCNENGFAETQNLPYGVYTVHQTKGKTDSEFLSDFDVFIAENGKTYKYLINNAPFEAFVKVTKTDKETGKTIPYAGAGFKIYDSNGNKISQTFTYPKKTTIDCFYTNNEGYLLTPEKLHVGNYSLVEIQAPYGYVLDSTPIPFTVSRSGAVSEDALTVIKVTRDNMAQKGIIRITKTGEVFASVSSENDIYTPVYQVQNLKNAVFEIFADKDIRTLDGTLRYEKGTKVDEITTGDDGIAVSKQLYLGKYKVTEKTAPNTFFKSDTEYEAELTYAGQNVSVTRTDISATNQRQKVEVTLTKALQQDNKFAIGMNGEIKNVQFGIYAAEATTASDGSVIPADSLVCVASCDENGKLVFDVDLPIGFSWYAKEIATDEQYILSDTKYDFNTEYRGQEVKTINIDLGNEEPIVNVLIYGSVKGIKTDRETKEAIKGAIFGLFKDGESEFTDKTAILTAVSDENGVFEFTDIPFGKWVIKELKPAKGYLANETEYPVEITENEQVIELKAVNDKIPELKTTATIGGKKNAVIGGKVVIQDEVVFNHLIPGEEYTVKGILMDKSTGKPLLINGKPVVSEITFTPRTPSGKVSVMFTFDSKYIKGNTDIVVFETLYKDGKEIATHSNIKDKGQTVSLTMPKAKVPETGDKLDTRKLITFGLAFTLAALCLAQGILKKKKSNKEDDNNER